MQTRVFIFRSTYKYKMKPQIWSYYLVEGFTVAKIVGSSFLMSLPYGIYASTLALLWFFWQIYFYGIDQFRIHSCDPGLIFQRKEPNLLVNP